VKLTDPNSLLRGFGLARLAIAAVLLAVGPSLPEELVPGTNRGIIALSLITVIGSSGALIALSPIGQPHRVAWLISLLDTTLVTAVVAATGGARSIFAFLYVLSVTAACLLLSRTGGLAIAATSSALYAGLVFGRTVFPMISFLEAPDENTALAIVTIFMNAGTFLVVAVVAGGLAERFRSTQQELATKQADLRDLEAFTDLIFDSVGTGIIALDREHRVTTLNRAAERIMGLAASSVTGRPWSIFGTGISLARIEAEVDASGRGSAWREIALRRPEGELPLRMTFSALRAGDGRGIGLIAACEDLSAIRAMEARMRAADRLATVGRMAANIAHEIRNPLAALSGAVEVMAAGAADDTRDRLAQIVLKETGRLNGIIREFLEYARPAPLSRVSVNVAETVDEVLVLLEHQATPGTLKTVREFPPALAWVVDRQQFRQAVWNLCLNAVQAMPEGGELRVAMAVSGGRLRLRVDDTGEGIAAADLGHVFEPFFSTKLDGTGLGLALVHRVVQDHGGDIDVQSRPGVGTSFTVTLPGIDD
jgi:two-component system sensor histidine kinase PilS (NtrC family)